MSISANDISVVFSGGSSNSDPSSSLGGDPSSIPVTSNLFDDVTPEEVLTGRVDYRCIYVFNNSESDALFNSQIVIQSQVAGGSDIEVGVFLSTDIQKITISGTISGGSFTIFPSLIINYNVYLTTWAGNIQTALNTQTEMVGATVSGASSGGNIIFTITFSGTNNNRFQDLLEISSDDLIGSTGIIVTKSQDGSPVNSVPSLLSFSTNIPFGVNFSDTSAAIGILYAGDGVPIWLQRTTAIGVAPLADDGVTVRLKGTSSP